MENLHALRRLLGEPEDDRGDAGWGFLSTSQEGEDMILWYLLDHQQHGFYVDVGAHDPIRYSNTAHFYALGWRGINIDADSDAVEALDQARPEDTNVNVGVGASEGQLEFAHYPDRAMNTFDEQLVKERGELATPIDVSHVTQVPVRPLGTILHDHLQPGHRIDFLSVDVEGKDLEVLESNDWEAFRPRFVLVECLGMDLQGATGHPTVRFLASLGYSAIAKSANTVILRDIA